MMVLCICVTCSGEVFIHRANLTVGKDWAIVVVTFECPSCGAKYAPGEVIGVV